MESASEQVYGVPARAVAKVFVPLSISALSLLAVTAIVPAVPSIAHSFARTGATNAAFLAQLVLIIGGLASIVSAPIVGIASRHIGKRRTLLVTLALFAIAGSVGLFQPGFAILLASRIVVGFSAGALGMLGLVLIADFYDGPTRFKLLGINGAVTLAATILAMVLCGGLVDRFGWGSAFAIYPIIAVPTLLVAMFAIAEPPISDDSGYEAQKLAEVFWNLAPVYPIYLLITIFLIGQYTVAIQGPFLLSKLGVTKAATLGLMSAIPIVTSVASSISFGYLYAKLRERQIVIFVFSALSVLIAATAFSTSLTEVAACYVLMGLVSGIILPAQAAMVIARALPGTREPALGILLSMGGLAQFLNPVVTAPIAHLFGVRGAFLAIALMLLVTAIALFAGSFGRSTLHLANSEDSVESAT